MRKVDVAPRLIGVQVLHEGGCQALDHAFPQAGQREREKEHAISGSQGAEKHAGAHQRRGCAEGPTLAPAPGGKAAEEHRRHHGEGAPQMQRAPRRHASVLERKPQVARQRYQRHGDHHRAGSVSKEGGESGIVIPPEGHPSWRFQS